MIDCTDEQLIEEVRRRGFVIRDAQIGREWVGLTDEEISLVDWKPNETLHDYARDIEARLKEKNGG